MTIAPVEPTDEGRRKYPPDGYYMEGEYERDYPCTCEPYCPHDCKGECGCKACRCAYGDFLSSE